MSDDAPSPAAALLAAFDRLVEPVLVLDPAGIVRHANVAATALLRGAGGPLGRPIRQLLPALAPEALAAAGRVTVTCPGVPGRFEVTIAHDATGTTLVLREAPASLHEAVDLVTDGVYEWDIAHDRVRGSARLAQLLGYPAGHIAPTVAEWFRLVHPDDAPAARAALARHVAGQTPRYEAEYRVRTADGRWLWVWDRGRVVERDGDGRALRMVGANAEVTARKELEERLQRAQRLQAIGVLAGGLAHDFNNLLTVVRGHARFLLRALPDGEARRDAEAIRAASERAAGLTRQLLVLGRREVAAPRRIAVDDVVAAYAELLDRVVGAHVHIELALAAGRRPVRLDPTHLEQALLNLVLNARDAMAHAGTLRIATAWVGADDTPLVAPRGAVRLTVRDDGAGMDAATAARAFEPFFTTKPAGQGTGIGLPAVLGIVEQAGGRTWLESEPGAGTTVHLEFPVTDGVAEPLVAAHAPAPPAPGTGRVLLAEDDPEVRALLRRTLEDAGYAVSEAEHGVAALERYLDLAAQGAPVAALVSDVRMPRLDGHALARALRAEDPTLAIVLVTGYDDVAVDGAGDGSGVRTLAKPFTPEALVRTLAEAIDDAATVRALASGEPA